MNLAKKSEFLTTFYDASGSVINHSIGTRCFLSCLLCLNSILLHFVAFFHVVSLFSTRVDNEKVGVDNKKALQLDNRIISSHSSKNAIKHPVA